jgi:single-strand DNA-binding protein
MSASLNKQIIIGNIGKDPELKETGNGKKVTSFTVATNKSWTDSNNDTKTHTEWHIVVAWGKLAELTSQYLKKGSLVYVEGETRTKEWEDSEKNVHRTKEIIADVVQFLDKKESN